ncbi:MAG TPA: hypothetical protein VLC09_09165 [Polyangiaceae bacterium]|nr:hypothetical protein [Polyangiaceae bacterium]
MKLRSVGSSRGMRSSWMVLLAAGNWGCSSTPPPAEPQPEPEVASPTFDEAPQAVEPSPEPPAPPPPPPPPPLVLDKVIEKIQLPGGGGSAVLGAAPCVNGSRSWLVQVERKGAPTAQADLTVTSGCEIEKDGKGWRSKDPSSGEVEEVRYQLSSLTFDAKTSGLFIAVTNPRDSEGVLVLVRPDSVREAGFGRLSNTHYQLVKSGPNELTRVGRVWGPGPDGYEAYLVGVNGDGEQTETLRDSWTARTERFTERKAGDAAKEKLLERCPKLNDRLMSLEVELGEQTEYWVGVPTFVRADATKAVQELRACGAKATVEKLPSRG